MAHRGCPSPSFSQANCRCKMLAGRVSLQARTTLQAQLSQLLERISHYWCTLEGQVQPDAVRAGPDSWPQLRWVAVPLRVRRQVQVWKDRGLTPLSAWARAPGPERLDSLTSLILGGLWPLQALLAARPLPCGWKAQPRTEPVSSLGRCLLAHVGVLKAEVS